LLNFSEISSAFRFCVIAKGETVRGLLLGDRPREAKKASVFQKLLDKGSFKLKILEKLRLSHRSANFFWNYKQRPNVAVWIGVEMGIKRRSSTKTIRKAALF
jgi:hypothetical protein